ncbi:MAG: MerR family transcriptional regulator [Fibrobacteria bacterium]
MTKANLKRLEEGKLYYSISEVCAMTGLEQHVLRYWESEFPQLRPKKNRSGNRAYRAKEIKIIRYIKYLLYEEMYTIPGAKKKMADANMADLEGQLTLLRVPASPPPTRQAIGAFATAVPAPEDTEDAQAFDTAAAYPGNGHGPNGSAVAAALKAAAHDSRGSTAEPGTTDAVSSHAHDGGEAAMRLREELKRIKQELQSLLAALVATGRTSP